MRVWASLGRCNGAGGIRRVATASTQTRRAARLLGAAEARLKAGAGYWGALEKLCVGRVTTTAMAQLGEAAFTAAEPKDGP